MQRKITTVVKVLERARIAGEHFQWKLIIEQMNEYIY